jgi:small subunit ribosomal protein S4e
MTHLKRESVPKRWPVPRKGTTFVVRPNFSPQRGIPLLIILRDMLKLCQNRKEVKRAIYEKKIFVNGKEAKDEKNPLMIFDTITIIPSDKSYRVSLAENGKYNLEEIKTQDASYKINKIAGKKIMKDKKIQINLRDGKNFLSETKCKIGDSVLINMKTKKIEKCLTLKEGAKIIVVEGKHSGSKGIIEKLKPERKMAKIKISGKDINVLIKQIMAVE